MLRNLSQRNNTRCCEAVGLSPKLIPDRLSLAFVFYFKYLLIAGSDILGNLPFEKRRSTKRAIVITRGARAEASEKIPRGAYMVSEYFFTMTIAQSSNEKICSLSLASWHIKCQTLKTEIIFCHISEKKEMIEINQKFSLFRVSIDLF